MRTLVLLHVLVFFVVSGYSFVDDHNDGLLSGWSIVGTRMWVESNGTLKPTSSNNEGFIICDSVSNMQLGNLTVRVKTDQWSGGNGGIVFCYNDASSYYFVTIEPKSYGSGTVTLHKNTTSGVGTVINSSLEIQSSDFSTLSITLSADSLLFSLNGEMIGAVAESSIRGGSFGYYHNTSWSAYVTVENSEWEEVVYSNGPLEIIQQPQDIHVFAGGNGKLEVLASNSDSTTYQWYSDSGLVVGAEQSTLLLSMLSISDSGSYYYCEVTNQSNVITSDTAYVHVSTATRKMITLKGSLNDFNAKPIGENKSTEVDLLVRLYNASQSGQLLYEEAFFKNAGNAVTVDSGIFHVRLGAPDSLDLTNVFQENQSVFAEFHLAIPGNSFEKLAPRVAITATPYALSANATVLKGTSDPNVIGLDAPVGTIYVAKENNNTYIKAVKSWVLLTE